MLPVKPAKVFTKTNFYVPPAKKYKLYDFDIRSNTGLQLIIANDIVRRPTTKYFKMNWQISFEYRLYGKDKRGNMYTYIGIRMAKFTVPLGGCVMQNCGGKDSNQVTSEVTGEVRVNVW